MVNIMAILKVILGMKLGYLLLIIGGTVLAISLVKNILSGSFGIAKFASGFNIFAGGVQGKLIYFGILAILAFGLYHQLTKATTEYNTDYRNNIHHNQDVMVDQRAGATCIPTKILWGLIQFGCNSGSMNKIVNGNKTTPTTYYPIAGETKR